MLGSCKKKQASLVEAGIANGALVVSYTGADNPRIWRGSMALASTATVELQEAPGAWRVLMKAPGVPEEEILLLKDKAVALEAFQAITRVLMSGAPAAAAPRRRGFLGWIWRLIVWIFVAALVVILGAFAINRFVLGTSPTALLLSPPAMDGAPAAGQQAAGQEALPSVSPQMQQLMEQQRRIEAEKIRAQQKPVVQGVPVPADELFGDE